MNQRSFSLNVISYDTTREEAIDQIANTLEYLEQTCNEIFNSISTSIQNTRIKIKNYDERINLIDLKVNKIKGSNKVTKIYSSAKYPFKKIEKEDNN